MGGLNPNPILGLKPLGLGGFRMMGEVQDTPNLQVGVPKIGGDPTENLILGLNPPVFGLERGWGWHSAPSSFWGGWILGSLPFHFSPGGVTGSARRRQVGHGAGILRPNHQKRRFSPSAAAAAAGGRAKLGGGGEQPWDAAEGWGAKLGRGLTPKEGEETVLKSKKKERKKNVCFRKV